MHTILCLPGTGKQRASFVDRYYQGLCIGFLFVIYKAKNNKKKKILMCKDLVIILSSLSNNEYNDLCMSTII